MVTITQLGSDYYNSIRQFTSLFAAHARTRQIRARLVGYEGWLGLDGRPSLSTGHMVSLTPDVPPPPSTDQFHRNRLTMSDVFIRTACCSHVRPLCVNLTQYLSRASQETFVTITGALTTLSPLLHSSWHVHLSPAVTCVQAHNGGRPVCNRALTVFLTL